MSTYIGSNQQLQYDATTGTWSLANVAQNFIDISTFSTADPKFEYTTPDDSNDDSDDDTTIDPCPLGYMLQDGACVIDPNYVPSTQSSGGGGSNQPSVTEKDPFTKEYEGAKEAIESFIEFAQKGKINFESYDNNTGLMDFTDPNTTLPGQNFNLIGAMTNPIITIGTAIMDSFGESADLREMKNYGIVVADPNNPGKLKLDGQAFHDTVKTKVLNPGVFEGTVLANTPSYYGLKGEYYKEYAEGFIKPLNEDDRKFFGSININRVKDADIAASAKTRTGDLGDPNNPFNAAGMSNSLTNQGFETFGGGYYFNGKKLSFSAVNKLVQSGIKDPAAIVAEIKKDEKRYIEEQEAKAQEQAESEGSGEVGSGDAGESGTGVNNENVPRPEGAGSGPGSGYTPDPSNYNPKPRPEGAGSGSGSGYTPNPSNYTSRPSPTGTNRPGYSNNTSRPSPTGTNRPGYSSNTDTSSPTGTNRPGY